MKLLPRPESPEAVVDTVLGWLFIAAGISWLLAATAWGLRLTWWAIVG